uniref:Uncharacterized protein n=1 Tax=Plectus sambesii TaxID=2011161 RepID=A0A914WSJ2_9BILA
MRTPLNGWMDGCSVGDGIDAPAASEELGGALAGLSATPQRRS